MIWHICALYDRVSGSYQTPFAVPAVGVATRMLQEDLKNKQEPLQPFQKHPGDFELWKLAVMDPESGTIVPVDKPELMCRLSSLLESAE